MHNLLTLKKSLRALAVLAFMAMPAAAQTGGITRKMLEEIEQAAPATAPERALRNAIAGNSIDALAKNARKSGQLDAHFSVETPRQSIHNQRSSGRCWMFSGLNVLRSRFARQHHDTLSVEFSHAYLFFYDQLEKANLFLQSIIDSADKPIDDPRVSFLLKAPIGDGGTFCGVADLTEKYGLVPMSVMPETYSSDNTSRMQKLLKSKLRQYALELRQAVAAGDKSAALTRRKTQMLATVYRMLSLTLGEPVREFTYRFTDKDGRPVGQQRHYTPQEFYRQTVGGPLNGTFIMAMNDPRHPYYKTYEVELDRHTYDGHNWKYINLPMDDIARMAIASLRDSTKLYSSYDVSQQLDRTRGLNDLDNYDYATLFDTDFPMTKAERISTFDSGSTHAMTLTAVDLDADGRPLKWEVENSWGPDYGYKGYLVMTNDWFNEYSFRLVVDKKYVPADILEAERQAPVMLSPEDPLFQADR